MSYLSRNLDGYQPDSIFVHDSLDIQMYRLENQWGGSVSFGTKGNDIDPVFTYAKLIRA